MIRLGSAHPVGPVLGARYAFVQAVQRIPGLDAVLAPLLARRLVLDHDRDLGERAPVGIGDRRDRAIDQPLERGRAGGRASDATR